MEPEQRRRPLDHELLERAEHAPASVLAVDVVDDQLGDHRVVETGDLVARADAGVDAHAGPARLAVGRDPPRRREEAAGDVLGVDPALDRVTAEDDVLLARRRAARPPRSRTCSRTRSSPVTSSVTVCSTWIARVHLEEEVLAVRVEQPFDRPGRAVPDGPRGLDRDRADPRSQLVVDGGRRRLLDELLMAALDRAVALAEVDRRSRARRRGPAPRRGAGPRGSARRRRRSRRSTPHPRAAPMSNARSSSSSAHDDLAGPSRRRRPTP